MKKITLVCFVIFLMSCSKGGYTIGGWYGNGGYSGNPPAPVSYPGNNVKADISIDGTISHISIFYAIITKTAQPSGDSSLVYIKAMDASGDGIQIRLYDILTPGLYSFGHISGQYKGVKASCIVSGFGYNSNYDELSGSINIDTLTTERIRGSFNVTCWHGLQAADMTNGSFAGNIN